MLRGCHVARVATFHGCGFTRREATRTGRSTELNTRNGSHVRGSRVSVFYSMSIPTRKHVIHPLLHVLFSSSTTAFLLFSTSYLVWVCPAVPGDRPTSCVRKSVLVPRMATGPASTST